MKYKLNIQNEDAKFDEYELQEDDFKIFSTRKFSEHQDLSNKCNFKTSKIQPSEKEDDIIDVMNISDEE